MKKLFLLVMLFGAVPAFAEDEKSFEISTKVGFFSDYMFRGLNLYDGASIQPAVDVKYDTGMGSVTASLWNHISGQGNESLEAFYEMDETLAYSNDFGPLSVTLGNVWYTYPDGADPIKDTAEVYATLSYDTLLTPTFSVYQDWQEFDSQYYELSFSHQLGCDYLGDGFKVTPFAIFGFASNSEDIYESNGFVQSTVGLTLDEIKAGKLSVTPTIDYTFSADDLTEDRFWFGLTLGQSF